MLDGCNSPKHILPHGSYILPSVLLPLAFTVPLPNHRVIPFVGCFQKENLRDMVAVTQTLVRGPLTADLWRRDGRVLHRPMSWARMEKNL